MPKLSNRAYNFIKWLVTIGLPGSGALYFALAQIWGFPGSEGVNGTINAVAVFLGLIIGYSTSRYNASEGAPDGDLIVNEADGTKYLALGVNKSIDDMTSKDSVRLNVVDNSSQAE